MELTPPMAMLNRQTIDRIARAVLSGQRGYGEEMDRLADLIAGLVKSRLEAVGASGAQRAQGRGRTATAFHDPHILKVLLDRVEKHLAWEALVKSSHGRSQPR